MTGPYSDLYIGKLSGDLAAAGSFDVQNRTATVLGTGEEKVSFTTMRDVGQLLVSALHTPITSSPRTLKVNSFTTTPSIILSEFEKQTNSKWTVKYTPLEELKRLETEAWESNNPKATAYTLRRIWTEGSTLYEERDNAKINDPETETLEEQVKKAIENQLSGL